MPRYADDGAGPPDVGARLSRRGALHQLWRLALAATAAPMVSAGCSALNSSARDDKWWDSVMTPATDTPTITASPASRIAAGVRIAPTADYNSDPFFRFDGCHDILLDSFGAYAQPPEVVVPEIVTDAVDIEAVFRAGRDGAKVIGVRAVVDGKLSHLQLRRFDAKKGDSYYFRHEFSDPKVRHLKFEVDGANRFSGVVVGNHTILRRPESAHMLRHVAIGDSLQSGGANYHPGSEESGDFFYMRWESHSRFQAALMGCDSYINLGVGGTGWGENVPSDPFSARVPLAVRGVPQILGFYGSRNDVNHEVQVPHAVEMTLQRVAEVPVVLVSGPQQAGFSRLNELVKQEVEKSRRIWLDLDGVAAAPTSNPTGHPTFDEQLDLARAAFSQTDMSHVRDAIEHAK